MSNHELHALIRELLRDLGSLCNAVLDERTTKTAAMIIADGICARTAYKLRTYEQSVDAELARAAEAESHLCHHPQSDEEEPCL